MAIRPDGPLQQIERDDRHAIAIIAAFLAARVAFAYALGPGVDESYTLGIARTLNLSYFDHPPLHQWIVHFAARALGEGFGARLPFIAIFAATGWIYYKLALGLFGGRAAIVAVFALNAAPFFFASVGTWIVPDGPLLFGLALAALALARLFLRRLQMTPRSGACGSPPAPALDLQDCRNTAPRSAWPVLRPSFSSPPASVAGLLILRLMRPPPSRSP